MVYSSPSLHIHQPKSHKKTLIVSKVQSQVPGILGSKKNVECSSVCVILSHCICMHFHTNFIQKYTLKIHCFIRLSFEGYHYSEILLMCWYDFANLCSSNWKHWKFDWNWVVENQRVFHYCTQWIHQTPLASFALKHIWPANLNLRAFCKNVMNKSLSDSLLSGVLI